METATLQEPVAVLPADNYHNLVDCISRLEKIVRQIVRSQEAPGGVRAMREAETEYQAGDPVAFDELLAEIDRITAINLPAQPCIVLPGELGERLNLVEQVTTIKFSDTPYVILPEELSRQVHWLDGQQVRITLTERGFVLILDIADAFEQTLEAYQSTGDEELADALLDMVDGCLGAATPDEYDHGLKWGGYYEGR